MMVVSMKSYGKCLPDYKNEQFTIQPGDRGDDLVKTINYAGMMLVTMLAAGCSTPNNASYTPPSWLNTANTCEANGLKITADPIFGGARSRAYFDTDAIEEGIFPVHVIAHNSNPNATILFQKANLKLAIRSESNLSSTVARNGRGTDGAGVLLFNPLLASPLLIPYIYNNEAIKYNFTRQELRDKALSPGQSTEGFVYFQIPKGTHLSEGSLRITVTNVRSQEDTQIEVRIIHDESDR